MRFTAKKKKKNSAKKKRMRFTAKNSAIREEIALSRANQIARNTNDFQMGVIIL